MIRTLFFALALLSAVSLFGQEVANDTGASSGIDVLGGVAIFSEAKVSPTHFGINVWTKIRCFDGSGPRWCLRLDMPIWWRPRWKDPWKRMPPIIVFPPFPPDPGPWDDFPLNELELGNTLILAPSIGFQFQPAGSRFSLELFGGGGFQYIQGNSSVIQQATYRTTNATAPLLTYGAAARIGIGKNVSAKVEARGLTTFEGNLNVIGPDGTVGVFEAMTMTSPMLSVGLGVGF